MYSSAASIAVLASFVATALAGPVEIRAPVLATGSCNHNNLYRSMVDPRYSSSASDFCSAFIKPTAYVTTTVSSITVTTAAVKTTIVPRAVINAATFSTFPASQLSSACSCILTDAPATATVVIATVTVPVTTTATATAISHKYVQEWDQDNCGLYITNIGDYAQDGLTKQEAIDDCANTCSNNPDCSVFGAYYVIQAGGDYNRPRCSIFANPYNPRELLCPAPNYDIGYSFGASKVFL